MYQGGGMENPFKWQLYQSDIILLTVRWYLKILAQSQRFEEMMSNRGLLLDYAMIYRWVQRFAPELYIRGRLI